MHHYSESFVIKTWKRSFNIVNGRCTRFLIQWNTAMVFDLFSIGRECCGRGKSFKYLPFYQCLKAYWQICKKWCFEKYCSCDKACQFSTLWSTYTLMELFRKPGNWRQICKQTSSTFYISKDVFLWNVFRRKNYYDVITGTFL